MSRCPVCKTECGEEKTCAYCGFDEIVKEFLNIDEAELWYNNILLPYRNRYLEKNRYFKIENNDLVKFYKEN